uniref:Plus3 domain-containing protein n=1 Tax=Caenorhabditis tropicalis TaxID=1561998 RepID=A0A1I7UBR6_9PELO
MEARESARAREEIAQQLAKKAKKNEKGKSEKRRKMNSGGSDGDSPKRRGSSDSDSEMDAEFHHPSEINRKHKEKNAMDALKSKRREIEKKKNAKKTALSIDAVFGANSGSSSSSSSSESSRSSSSSRESSPERAPEQEKVIKKEVESLAELRKARLSRHKLSLMVHAPFFDSTVVGCFVRLGQGMMSGSESKYRIWKIIGVEQTNKVYDLEGKKTNKSIKCQFGKTERLFRMQFVSNSEFEKVEFDEWYAATKANGSVPTVDVMEKKQADITKAVNHKYSDKEVDAMIQEKSKFQKITRNFAMTKAGLSKEKELAQQRGDIREAERVQKQIDEIERHADELDKERSKSIRAIAFINHRNRTQIKDQVLSGKLKIEENSQDDPFTRKKGGMRIVSGSKSKLDGTLSASSSITNLTEVATEKSSSIAKPTQPPPIGSKDQKNKTNMSSLHDFDLDIDFDKLNNFSTSSDTSSKRPSIGTTKMSLGDYRMRRSGGGDTGPSTSATSSSAY